MNDDAIEAIVAIIIIIGLILVVVTPVIAMWIYIFYQNSKRKKIVQRILAGRPEVIGNKRWFPAVRITTEVRFPLEIFSLGRGGRRHCGAGQCAVPGRDLQRRSPNFAICARKFAH